MLAKIVNGVAFQGVWVACVWGGATGRWWLGVVAAALFAAWQVPRSPDPAADLRLLGVVSVLGFVVDSVWAATGLITYASPVPSATLAPLWIVALWAGFALTLNHSMDWLAERPGLAALFGGIGGPLSFWIGANWWAAAEFSASTPVVVGALAVGWGTVTPLLFAMARRMRTPAPAAPGEVEPVAT
jgi:hypothetical protein